MLACSQVKAIKEAFISERVEAFVQPLAVIPLGKDRGIIEVNPSAKTRDQLCMASGGNLQQHLVQSFGPVHSEEYQKARTCYVQSLAGCCLVSFLLQVRDSRQLTSQRSLRTDPEPQSLVTGSKASPRLCVTVPRVDDPSGQRSEWGQHAD